MAEAGNEGKIAALRDAGNLDELYAALTPLDMTPGWIDREKPILWEQPDTPFHAMHWQYDECRAALDAAAGALERLLHRAAARQTRRQSTGWPRPIRASARTARASDTLGPPRHAARRRRANDRSK